MSAPLKIPERKAVTWPLDSPKPRTRVEFTPMCVISLRNDETKKPPLMVICRAPADDGWLAIEAETCVIYNLFDTVTHLYRQWGAKTRPSAFGNLNALGAALAKAEWYFSPKHAELVGRKRSAPRKAPA